jgi:hypothetical protein
MLMLYIRASLKRWQGFGFFSDSLGAGMGREVVDEGRWSGVNGLAGERRRWVRLSADS